MNSSENKWRKRLRKASKEAYWFLSSKIFLKNCAIMLGVAFLLIFLAFMWLRWYTNHGQSIQVDNYVGESIEMAQRKAKKKSFRLQVNDSIFIVGKEGGIILEQNPKPGAKVKKRRTIYVSVSKYHADKILLENLPIIYGKEFKNIKRLLESRYELNCEVASYEFDTGPENHILKLIYKGDTLVSKNRRIEDAQLEKGTTVHFVLSTKKYAPVESPDLICKTFESAAFIVRNSGLIFGEIYADATVSDTSSAIVWKQTPPYIDGNQMQSGDTIDIYLTQAPPANCQ